jgi:Metallopeptidase family M24
LVLLGAAAALPHGSKLPQKLKEGDVVLIDGGCTVDGELVEGPMETERIALSQRERDRDRLRVLHEIKRKQITQIEAARRLKLSDRHIRRLLAAVVL